jgi:hypothetical protein
MKKLLTILFVLLLVICLNAQNFNKVFNTLELDDEEVEMLSVRLPKADSKMYSKVSRLKVLFF